jgi:hypothetical protein
VETRNIDGEVVMKVGRKLKFRYGDEPKMYLTATAVSIYEFCERPIAIVEFVDGSSCTYDVSDIMNNPKWEVINEEGA